MVKYIRDKNRKEEVSSIILSQLPEWFGLPESTAQYIENSRNMPFWTYFEEEQPVGFIVLKETGTFTVEIYVMGILKEYHRKGIGRTLWRTVLEYARSQGYEYIQVKTVQKGKYKEYDITNSFYEALGFKELECLPALWEEWNPCQIYVKYIGKMTS